MTRVADDEDAIRTIVKDQQEAWRIGDAERLAARFLEDGSFTNVRGDYYIGREAFKERHAVILKGIFINSEHQLKIRRIQFPVRGVAIVDIDAAVIGYRELPTGVPTPPDGVLRTKLLQVLVKNDRGWWITAYHNVDVKA